VTSKLQASFPWIKFSYKLGGRKFFQPNLSNWYLFLKKYVIFKCIFNKINSTYGIYMHLDYTIFINILKMQVGIKSFKKTLEFNRLGLWLCSMYTCFHSYLWKWFNLFDSWTILQAYRLGQRLTTPLPMCWTGDGGFSFFHICTSFGHMVVLGVQKVSHTAR
jgi:hypothetical protein